MKVKVNGQSKKFWLAFPDGWKPAYGHEITVGEYSFSACSFKQGILVSEVTTGTRVKLFPHNFLTTVMGATREGTLDYYEIFIAPTLANVIRNNPDIKTKLATARNRMKNLGIGDMPPIVDFDDSLLTELISDIKH